jgi:hypothetical protein
MSNTVIEEKPVNPKADEWAERIAAQQRSGISVKQFCKDRGLTEYSFYAWRNRLQESGLVRFALVEKSARRQERTAEPALELVLATGERLRSIGARAHKTFLSTIVFTWNRSGFKLNARWPSIRTACRAMQRRCEKSSWIWPNNWIVP